MRHLDSAGSLVPVLVFLAVALAIPAVARAQDEEAPPPPPGPDTPITEMVLIPGGVFTMGKEGDEEMPPHKVRVDDFWIDRTEVTNAQYLAFAEATGAALPVFWGLDRFCCTPDHPDHPVLGVSHAQAAAYAAWVGKRLPTEAEWEYAARGGLEGRDFDVEGDLTPDQANYKASGNDHPVPVGRYRPNAFGIHDMVGNVREFVADRWSVFEGDPDAVLDDPAGPDEGRWRVVKGGGWYSGKMCNTVHRRNVLPPHWQDFNVGFRCARDAKPGEEAD